MLVKEEMKVNAPWLPLAFSSDSLPQTHIDQNPLTITNLLITGPGQTSEDIRLEGASWGGSILYLKAIFKIPVLYNLASTVAIQYGSHWPPVVYIEFNYNKM